MISAVDVWTFVHILLFVYWLGADLGVFVAAQAASASTLTYPQRSTALQLALKVEYRTAAVVRTDVRLRSRTRRGQGPRRARRVATRAGLGQPRSRGSVSSSAWCVSKGDLGVLLQACERVAAFRPVGGLRRAGARLSGWLRSIPAGWLAWKVLLFALIFLCGIMIDRRFAPMSPAFAQLAATGSTPELERTITKAVDEAVHWVLALYALVIVIAFLGTARPF